MRWALLPCVSLCIAAAGQIARAQDPYARPPAGRVTPPIPKAAALPANSPQLSVARPYALFVTDTDRAAILRAPIGAAAAADWYRIWRTDVPPRAPAETPKAYADRVRTAIADLKRSARINGSVIASGPLAALVFLRGAADYIGPLVAPRITPSAAVNTYGMGYVVRLAADLGDRIPIPTLDLTHLSPPEAPWVCVWVDDAIRNGVAGLDVRMPADPKATGQISAALGPLRTPNVYLPPPSEVAVLVSLDQPAAYWDRLFACYAGLRASGVWVTFVEQGSVAGGEVPLARYRVIVAPGPIRDRRVADAVRSAARHGAIVVAVGSAGARGDRVLASDHSGRPAITEKPLGDGRWISAKAAPWSADGAWRGFWQGILRDAGVPNRPWLESVTAANVGIITGRYSRPAPVR